MRRAYIVCKPIKISGKEYKRGDEILDWRFIPKRTKQTLLNTSMVEEVMVSEDESES